MIHSLTLCPMRRLFLLPLVLLGFASAVATGSNDSRSATAVKASVAGTITTLGSNAITVHSFFDVTCKLTAESPALLWPLTCRAKVPARVTCTGKKSRLSLNARIVRVRSR